MSDAATIREELAADRIRISQLIAEAERLQERYRVLTEDPTAVTAASLQSFVAELDTFRDRGNEILNSFRALANFISQLPNGAEKDQLSNERAQLANQTSSWVNNTFVPFRDTVRSEAARVAREDADRETAGQVDPTPIGDYTAVLNDGTGPGDVGTWYVLGPDGETVASGLTEQQARLQAEELSLRTEEDVRVENAAPAPQPNANAFQAVLNDGTGPGTEGTWYVEGAGGEIPASGLTQAEAEAEAARLNALPAPRVSTTPDQQAAAQQQTLKDRLQQQAARAAQRRQANEGDWRVKLRLAENANYLYRDPNLDEQGILWPLAITNGVIFPYTPTISTSYNASYSDQALTHSNYKGYFYQSSHVGAHIT